MDRSGHSARRLPELAVDFASAGTVFAWGVVGATRAGNSLTVSLVCLVVLNCSVAYLFLRRSNAVRVATVPELLVALPSIVLGPMLLHRAPPFEAWTLTMAGLFSLGCLFATWSLLSLGPSFAIFPALRETVTQGPYRSVRHPVYVGELAMAAAAMPGRFDLVGVVLLLLLIAATVVRIHIEESMLRSSESYRKYASAVRWRLAPFIW